VTATFVRLAWLIPLLPFVGAAFLGILGCRLSKKVVAVVACSTVGLAFLVSVGVAAGVLGHLPAEALGRAGLTVHEESHAVELTLWEWIDAGERHVQAPGETVGRLGELRIPVAFLLDPLSAIMLLVVTGVGFLIHVYATSYMEHEDGYWRFFSYLNLFVFFMLVLVLGNSFALLFVGWEGVGLCSYLLIGFYYGQTFPPLAGMKAFLVNRVGDFGFMIGMLLVLLTFGTLRFTRVGELVASSPGFAGSGLAIAIAACLFVGATGKSAQVPLFVWLPDAMAGPTPVSALIHAATMVTAGVYLVIRANVLFQAAPQVSAIVACVGAFTAILAATIALVQNDLKKVLAYSTVSQLGYMFLAVGVGAYAAGLFHLVTHAFFKALLFLGAGSVSHALAGELDMRKMGALKPKLKHTWRVMLVATIAIAGIPPLAGFWSKDEILAGAITAGFLPVAMRWSLWGVGIVTAVLTAFYMFRLFFRTFHGEKRWGADVHPHESPWGMLAPLYVLAVLSALGGLLGLGAWTGAQNLIHGQLHHVVHAGAVVDAVQDVGHGLELGLVGLASAAGLLGLAWAWRWYGKRSEAPARLAAGNSGVHRLLRHGYFVDEAYQAIFVGPLVRLARWSGIFDRRFIDLLVEGTGIVAALCGEVMRGLTSGRVRTYALTVFVGAVGLAAWLLAR
jgi:NADH-quinone oxidoreductase subunit L